MHLLNINHHTMNLELPFTPKQPIVINVARIPNIWDHNVKVGDMVGFCNIISHLRYTYERPDIKIFFDPLVIDQKQHCFQFHNFLSNNTDYIASHAGDYYLPLLDIWQYRFQTPIDYMKITNRQLCQKKICIFPVLDAQYNKYRNWTITATQQIIDRFSAPEFSNHEKLFCSIVLPNEINYKNFVISQDYVTNLQHIMSCEWFVGGDTGTSHFAGSLSPSPPHLLYYLNRNQQDTKALPFHFRSHGTLCYF